MSMASVAPASNRNKRNVPRHNDKLCVISGANLVIPGNLCSASVAAEFLVFTDAHARS